MLTPEQIDALRAQAEQIAEPISDYLIRDIARRIKTAGQLTSTAAYQIWSLQLQGKTRSQIRRELRKLLGTSVAKTRKLMRQTAEVGYNFDLTHLPTNKAVPFAENEAAQSIVNAAVELAEPDFTNLSQTIGMVDQNGRALSLQEVYRSATDFAFKQVFTGAADYNTAIRQATANIAKYGVRVIDYESGVHTSLEAAVRRNILGGMGLMLEQIAEYNHDALDADGWEISAHAASAPDHEPIQGKQYTDAEYAKLNASLKRRIGTLNCGHVAFPVILGVSQPQFTEKQLKQLAADNAKGVEIDGKQYSIYEATQKQRQIERKIRAQKRRVMCATDETRGQASTKLTRLRQEYDRYSKKAGLRTEKERLHVAEFGRKEAGAARSAANTLAKQESAAYNKAISDARQAIANNPKTIVKGQQNKHIAGTHEYVQYVKAFEAKGQYGPSRFNGTLEDAQRLVTAYSGTGNLKIVRNKWLNYEEIDVGDGAIGTVVNNLTGQEIETTLFKIHYRKSGVHIVPDYPSKRRKVE